MKRTTIFILFICMLFTACQRDPVTPTGPVMPTPSQSGKNIGAFKVNGTYHQYDGKTSYWDDNGVYYTLIHDGSIDGFIIKLEDTKYDDYLKLYVKDSFPDVNVVYKITSNYPWDDSHYGIGNGNNEYTADSFLSTITFTRADDKVIAGTFEFVGKRDSAADILITEGWFDIAR